MWQLTYCCRCNEVGESDTETSQDDSEPNPPAKLSYNGEMEQIQQVWSSCHKNNKKAWFKCTLNLRKCEVSQVRFRHLIIVAKLKNKFKYVDII